MKNPLITIKVSTVKQLMRRRLKALNLKPTEASFIINHFLEAEMAGKTTHGIGKFCWESQFFHERLGKPEIVIDNKSTVLIDAHKEIGPLSAKFALDTLIKRTKKHGLALVAMQNSQRYGALYSWTKVLAEYNLVGIIINTSESLVPHPDGIEKTLGTNPIGISIPTAEDPLLIDMATSKEAMGLTWQALREEVDLPADTFFDDSGKYTVDPHLASAVEVFGQYKGYALSLLIQILSTSLLGLSTEVTSQYDIGYVFLAINPTIFVPLDQFKHSNSLLANKIKSGEKRLQTKPIRLPGEIAFQHYKEAAANKTIQLPLSIWKALKYYEKK